MAVSIQALSWQPSATQRNMLRLRQSFMMIATISGMLSLKYNRTFTNDDSCDQKDESPEYAESMVSNNSTIGCIPHEAGQLSSPPPTPTHIIPVLTHSHLGSYINSELGAPVM